MSRVSLEFEPLEIATRDVDAVKNSMARLRVRVDGECVTSVLDKRARTTRDAITTSLYPLAEWMAANWWFLFFEPWTSGRESVNRTFDQRHSMKYAGDGFAWPDLRIVPEGEFSLLTWNSRATRHQNIDFLATGAVRLPRDEVRDAFGDFIESVLARLEAVGGATGWLHDEWTAIQEARSVDAQRRFCESAAASGMDPFDLNDEAASQIEDAIDALPPSLQRDFFEAAESPTMTESLAWIRSTETPRAEAFQPQAAFWSGVRTDVAARTVGIPSAEEPWQKGYRFAAHCRTILGLDGQARVPDDPGGAPLPVLNVPAPSSRSLDGIVRATEDVDVPVCITPRRGTGSRRFAFCRGLYDYLIDERPTARLLTTSQTSDQQAGRAFAAEFLAPSRILQSRIGGSEVGLDEVADLAGEFGVAEFVIRHQIVNHRLGRLEA